MGNQIVLNDQIIKNDRLNLCCESNITMVTIADNGKSFDIDQKAGKFGIISMLVRPHSSRRVCLA